MWIQIGNKVSGGLGTASLEVWNSARYSYYFYYTLEGSVWFLCGTKYWEKNVSTTKPSKFWQFIQFTSCKKISALTLSLSLIGLKLYTI